MNDKELRLECLRQAINIAMMAGESRSVLQIAEELFQFVWHGPYYPTKAAA